MTDSDANIELLKDEYALLYGLIDSFDNKTLTIKTWSVTVIMFGIGAACLVSVLLFLVTPWSLSTFCS
ncbi:MAG: hypothetical protein HC802_07535 [Caldilineaceae bacterium]|nr:hypothetical protein [Caldilineaceae bacterium]